MTQEKIEQFTVPADLTKLQAVVSTDRSRYNLTGVYFDGKNGVAVATDGCCLALKPLPKDADPQLSDRVVEFDKLKTPAKHQLPRYKFAVVDDVTGQAADVFGNGTARLLFADTLFPEYRQVVPKERKAELCVAINADLLAKLAGAISRGRDKFLTLSFDTTDPTAPILVTGSSGHGVLMPAKIPSGEPSPVEAINGLLNTGRTTP